MKYLLDTVAVSELRKRSADLGLVRWAELQDPLDLFISAVTVMELETGVLRKERLDPAQGGLLQSWVEGAVGTAFAGRTLAFDADCARVAAGFHVPRSRSLADSMIAATAVVHGLTVVTCNVKDFEPMGVRVWDPWGTVPFMLLVGPGVGPSISSRRSLVLLALVLSVAVSGYRGSSQ